MKLNTADWLFTKSSNLDFSNTSIKLYQGKKLCIIAHIKPQKLLFPKTKALFFITPYEKYYSHLYRH